MVRTPSDDSGRFDYILRTVPSVRPALLGLLALAVACSPAGGRRPGTVVLASGADLQSMNSLVTTHPLAKQVQRYALLTTLVRYDSALAIEPYLARYWSWSDDRRELILTIHGGVRWHDGRPTTAADVAWTLTTALDPAAGYPRLADLADLERATAMDEHTVSLRFRRPMNGIPDVLTDLAILPRHLLGEIQPSELRSAAWNAKPVGNGPFRFVRHEPNRRWAFRANEAFPPSLGGRPRIDRLVVAVVDEPMTKLAALVSGELDFAGIQPAHASFVADERGLAVLEYPLLFTYGLVFNTRRPPFDRLDVRRAIDLAIDRTALVHGYLFGFGRAASGPLPPELDSLAPEPFYAPGRGRVLLGEQPLDFELLTVGSGEAPLEQMLQSQLALIGIRVRIRQLELASFLDRVYGAARDFDAAVLGISGDPALGYLRSLLDLAGVEAPAGLTGRALLATFTDSMPVAFLYHARGVQGMNRRVGGVRMDLRGELPTVTRWTIE
ncbi:MAG: ABC transporter substrate-binding protein [Gemmatimonadales bacterium]